MEYRVRLGDDSPIKFRSEDYGQALTFAREYSRTNALHMAEIRDDNGLHATLENGQVTWKRTPKLYHW